MPEETTRGYNLSMPRDEQLNSTTMCDERGSGDRVFDGHNKPRAATGHHGMTIQVMGEQAHCVNSYVLGGPNAPPRPLLPLWLVKPETVGLPYGVDGPDPTV